MSKKWPVEALKSRTNPSPTGQWKASDTIWLKRFLVRESSIPPEDGVPDAAEDFHSQKLKTICGFRATFRGPGPDQPKPLAIVAFQTSRDL